MWGRSYYLDVQGAGDVVTRPRQCGQNGFCMIRPLSHGLDMPTSDLRDIGKTEIQAKHTTILYLHIFFQVWTPPQWICADRCRHFTFARSKNSGLGSHRPGQVLSLVIGAQELGTGPVPGWGEITTFCWDFPPISRGCSTFYPPVPLRMLRYGLFSVGLRGISKVQKVSVFCLWMFWGMWGFDRTMIFPLDRNLGVRRIWRNLWGPGRTRTGAQ